MKIKCICGNLMKDEAVDTCVVYDTFVSEDYYDVLDKEPKSVAELVDSMPLNDPFWLCKQCGRLHFFRKGKIQIFNLELEVTDSSTTNPE